MPWCRVIFWLGFVFLVFPARVSGQADRPFVSFDFARQNDYTFSSNLDSWIRWKSGKYELDLRLGQTSIYNTSLDSDRFVQAYLKSSIWQAYQWKPKVAIVSWIETDQYFTNRNEKVNMYAGLRFRPWDFLAVTPLLGYSMDVRTAVLGQTGAAPRLDQGFSPGLLFRAHKVWEDQDLSMTTDLFVRYKFIDPRRQYNVTLRHAWDKRFAEGVQIHASVEAGSHELDDYQGFSVKRIMSDSIRPGLQLSYLLGEGLEWQSENSFLFFRRRFLFEGLDLNPSADNNLTFVGMEAQTMQRLGIVRKTWRASASYEYQFGTRVYDLDNSTGMTDSEYENRLLAEKQKDFLRDFHRVDLMLEGKLSKRQVVTGRLTSQYLQYDTQSETNFDDRDELSYLGTLEWNGRWRRNFFTTAGLSANYRHYAFLFKEKSQENYIQRSLRMEFKYGWEPLPKLRLEGDNAVYVTYNVKDFSDFNKTDRSTRNLETNLKTFFRPSKLLQVETSFRRKETQQSYLNWDAFSETTLDTNTISTLEHRYRFQWQAKGKALFLECGYKHFEQTKRLKATMLGLDNVSRPVSLRQISDQTGPVLHFGMRSKSLSSVDIGVWMQVQLRRNKYRDLEGSDFYPNIFPESELQKTSTAVRPYFTIKTNIFLGT